jgi:membrane protein DedA with SNARE-associated domain
MSVLFTRFLITAIAVPVNLLAGTGNFPFRHFLLYDLAGEAIWIFGYGGLGFLFSTQWEPVSAFLSNMSGLLFGLLILGTGLWLGMRRLKTGTAPKEPG